MYNVKHCITKERFIEKQPNDRIIISATGISTNFLLLLALLTVLVK